jgi:molybdopterin synthase sulfur carrier subunit
MIRVLLPFHLRMLAHIEGELALEVNKPVTLKAVLDEIENQYPMLRGTIRNHHSQQRRPLLRFFACEKDLSHQSLETVLPEAVVSGAESLLIVGAIAGG